MRNFDNDNILMVYVKVALDTFNSKFMALEIVIMEETCSGKFIRPQSMNIALFVSLFTLLSLTTLSLRRFAYLEVVYFSPYLSLFSTFD